MYRADKTLTCRDCGSPFVFTSGEQEFYANRGFDNEPSRCPACRAARKTERGGAYAGGYGSASTGSGGGGRRELFSTTCAQCGREAKVPFQPRGDKPVYCSDCFDAQRGGTGRSARGGSR